MRRAKGLTSKSVSRLRQQLRQAAQAFADSIHDIFTEHLGAGATPPEVEPAPHSAPRRGRPPRSLSGSANALERVLMYVTEHGEVSPKAIAEATGISRSAVGRALVDACSLGALVRRGSGPAITYAVGLGEPEPPARARKQKRPPRGSAADVYEAVIAYVVGHPGCTRAELAGAFPVTLPVLRAALDRARAERRVRMDGARRTARYFAVREVHRSAGRPGAPNGVYAEPSR
jgi:hypothetical protein